MLADEPAFFVARDDTAFDVVAFAVGVLLGPPLVLLALEALVARWPKVRERLHLVFCAALLAAFALQILNGLGGPGLLWVVLALALGTAGALAYARGGLLPTVLTVLAPLPLLALVWFLLLSPVSDVVLAREPDDAKPLALSRPGPVVLVVFDELAGYALEGGDGRIDASRFPAFASLAKDASWYPRASSAADQTTRAVPAVLTGRRPGSDAVPTAASYPRNLFTLLGSRFRVDAEEPVTRLCPDRLCPRSGPSGSLRARARRQRALWDDLSVVSARVLLPDDLDDGLPATDRTFGGFRAGGRDAGLPAEADAAAADRPAAFARFLRRMRGGGKPPLGVLHLELPHIPWQYLPSGRSYPVGIQDPPGLVNEQWGPAPWPATQAEQRFLLQLGFADRLLGRLLSRLKQEGLYKRATIVVTADHGVNFTPRQPRRLAVEANLPAVADVPLLVKTPGQRAGRIDRGPARTTDVVPTIVAALGGRAAGPPLPAAMRGRGVVAQASALGGTVTTPFAPWSRRVDAARRALVATFGAGRGWSSVYAAGPEPGLVGRPVSARAFGRRARFRAAFDPRPELASFTPGGPTVPAFLTGELTGHVRAGEPVAVAVGDRVQAVTEAYAEGGALRFAAMVAPSAFRRGANAVRAFAVVGHGTAARLAPAGGAVAVRATLSGDTVRLADGTRVPVDDGAGDGRVDLVSARDGQITLHGWATDAAHRRGADRVLVFGDGKLLASGVPATGRPDVADTYGDGVAVSGWTFTGVPAPEAVATPGRLVVVGIAGGRAFRLEAPPSVFP